jgi:hypothetical protein
MRTPLPQVTEQLDHELHFVTVQMGSSGVPVTSLSMWELQYNTAEHKVLFMLSSSI